MWARPLAVISRSTPKGASEGSTMWAFSQEAVSITIFHMAPPHTRASPTPPRAPCETACSDRHRRSRGGGRSLAATEGAGQVPCMPGASGSVRWGRLDVYVNQKHNTHAQCPPTGVETSHPESPDRLVYLRLGLVRGIKLVPALGLLDAPLGKLGGLVRAHRHHTLLFHGVRHAHFHRP